MDQCRIIVRTKRERAMFFRVKHSGSYGYLQIVESFREQGQVRQRVLSTLGRVDPSKPAVNWTRFCARVCASARDWR